jgi:IS4 transposase
MTQLWYLRIKGWKGMLDNRAGLEDMGLEIYLRLDRQEIAFEISVLGKVSDARKLGRWQGQMQAFKGAW